MKKMISEGFGARVQEVRADTLFGKQIFARMVLSEEASAKNISRIENEEVTPRINTMSKIACFGGVSLDWLLTGRIEVGPTQVVKTAGVGRRIQRLRTQKGLSRYALSQKAGLGNSSQNIRRLELRHHLPRKATLEKLAAVLGVSADYLAFGT